MDWDKIWAFNKKVMNYLMGAWFLYIFCVSFYIMSVCVMQSSVIFVMLVFQSSLVCWCFYYDIFKVLSSVILISYLFMFVDLLLPVYFICELWLIWEHASTVPVCSHLMRCGVVCHSTVWCCMALQRICCVNTLSLFSAIDYCGAGAAQHIWCERNFSCYLYPYLPHRRWWELMFLPTSVDI